ncbi:MAG: hypothetical protein ACREDU_02715, partial [Methylocella sp.]
PIGSHGKVMLVVDQFEELFAYRRRGAHREDVISRDEAAGFVKLLLRSCAEPEGRVRVVLTMRSDFIGDCEAFLGLPEAVSQSQFLVPRLDRSQMEEVITRPGEVGDLGFQSFTFEEGLVNSIINEAGDRPDQLPLLQHALMRTWKFAVRRAGEPAEGFQLEREDYRAAGGIANAISRHADEAWKQIEGDADKNHIARQLFLQLCDISPDGQITRRRPRVKDIEAVTRASLSQIQEIVHVFQEDERNFLLPAADRLSSEDLLDISHEALLRQWRLFADDWQVQERDDVSELRRLAELARLWERRKGGLLAVRDLDRIEQWQARASPEWAARYVTKETWQGILNFIAASRGAVQKQRTKKRWMVMASVIILAVFMLGLALFSYQADTAKSAAQEALTNSYVRTIGVSVRDSDGHIVLSPDEWAALWELAEMDTANARVREMMIDRWLKNETLAHRAFEGSGRGLRAVVGTNSTLNAYTLSLYKPLADDLVATLENPKETDSKRLSSFTQALSALAATLEAAQAANLADRLVKRLEDPNETDGNYRLPALQDSLSALAARLEAGQAANLADRVIKRLEDPNETNPY